MNRVHRSRSHRPKARSGIIVLCLLVCLSVVISLLMTSVQTALRSRAEVRNQIRLVQASLLCEAGLQRAISELKKDSDYSGETWNPSVEEASFMRTDVTIRVSGKEFERTIDVVVQLRSSDAASDLIQRSKSIRFSTSQKVKDENKDE
jgi:type II secretory pathway component PulK